MNDVHQDFRLCFVGGGELSDNMVTRAGGGLGGVGEIGLLPGEKREVLRATFANTPRRGCVRGRAASTDVEQKVEMTRQGEFGWRSQGQIFKLVCISNMTP